MSHSRILRCSLSKFQVTDQRLVKLGMIIRPLQAGPSLKLRHEFSEYPIRFPLYSTTSRTHPRKSISNSIVSIGGRAGYHTTPCALAPPIGPNTSRSQKSPKLKTV